jgi:hypothetical protein
MKRLPLTTWPRLIGLLCLLALVPGPAGAAGPSGGEASRVRILLVCDLTGNETEQARRVLNRNTVKRVLQTTLREQGLEQRYTLDVLPAKLTNPEGVLAYYRDLETDPSETLFFYCNCHGGINEKRGPFLVLGGKSLYRSRLLEAMERKGPRLIVVLTDACGTYPKKTPTNQAQDTAARKALPAVGAGRNAGNGMVMRHLLFRHTGVVDINAAKPGEYSRGVNGRGEYFTLAYAELLDQPLSRFDGNGDRFVEWEEFSRALRARTGQFARLRGTTQTPGVFSLAKRAG